MNGKVNSIETKTYEALSEFGEIIPGKIYDQSHQGRSPYYDHEYHEKILFNNVGYKIREYKFVGKIEYGYVDFIYDEIGIIKEGIFTSRGDKGTSKINFIYDNNSNIIEENINNKVTYVYDSGNNISVQDVFDSDRLYARFKFRYNSKNELVESEEYNSGGLLEAKCSFRYNSKGNISKIIKYVNGAGKEGYDTDFEFEYDKEGNWIKRVQYYYTYTNERHPLLLTKRNITYYP